MTKICALSDLHGHLPKIESCELVLLAGDIVPLNIQFDNAASTLWFLDEFTKWIDSLPCDEVIMIAGNHDKLIERASFIIHAVESKTDFKLTYLSGTTYEYIARSLKHYKIYGSPFCHKFGNWAFMQSEEWLKDYYDNIPEDTDIILTHDTPMLGDLDLLLLVNGIQKLFTLEVNLQQMLFVEYNLDMYFVGIYILAKINI